MSRLTRDGTAEPVSPDHILRRERRHENTFLPCSADHEQDWQPYPVNPYSDIFDDGSLTADGAQRVTHAGDTCGLLVGILRS